MKTIKLLKILITIIFWGMIVLLGLGIICFILLLFFEDLFPPFLQGFNMLFNDRFPWQVWIGPIASVIAFVLFILAINYLRKCIAPIQEQRFYSEEVISNLKKSGRLFIIIALGTSFIRIVGVFMIKNLTNRLAYGGNLGGQIGVTNLMQTTDSSVWSYLGAILSAIGGTNFFLLIIGLFLLVFSSVFKEGQLLKEENDLTI
ncbi:DUF2975 domain-containing protein [Winogradskyella sp. E313]|uniref:DUF2975 domain-containing protein n=2 Tax=Winogradskyella immobilis TaxID=2816852 RepID=A0ABS8EPX8_9FLAO|nr:DUF2975 domain-containing protein [Winogradskyella immobilis]MCG0017376.1 DUF2975 domain-containing protein [Winogradskyella immobilis]